MDKQNYFEVLNSINVNEKVEKKNNLTYLSWAWAWSELKKRYPESTYTVYENEHGWNYHTDGRTCWVKTGVTVNGIEHVEYLPVMDYRNNSIPVDKVTSFDVNKAIQRSLTKAIGRHGIGLYIYAGEDLPEDQEAKTAKPTTKKAAATEPAPKPKSSEIDYRTALRNAIIDKGLEQKEIIQLCGLSKASTNEDYKKAFEYVKSIPVAKPIEIK